LDWHFTYVASVLVTKVVDEEEETAGAQNPFCPATPVYLTGGVLVVRSAMFLWAPGEGGCKVDSDMLTALKAGLTVEYPGAGGRPTQHIRAESRCSQLTGDGQPVATFNPTQVPAQANYLCFCPDLNDSFWSAIFFVRLFLSDSCICMCAFASDLIGRALVVYAGHRTKAGVRASVVADGPGDLRAQDVCDFLGAGGDRHEPRQTARRQEVGASELHRDQSHQSDPGHEGPQPQEGGHPLRWAGLAHERADGWAGPFHLGIGPY
jgi:hypothetical protein